MSLQGNAHQVMLQGVQELYELNETPQLWEEDVRTNRLVFIGEDSLTLHTDLDTSVCILQVCKCISYSKRSK